MHLGILTAPFSDQPLTEVADWAADAGFSALEIACWPSTAGSARRYAGTSHIDVTKLSASQADEIIASLKNRNLSVSALGFYPNPLHPDLAHRNDVITHLKAVIAAARLMGLGIVNTFVGGDHNQHVEANWEEAMRVWPEIIQFAADNGVCLAFENCPMIFSYDEWPAGANIAYSPMIWRRIFENWGNAVGMNFDPSHLILQMIDQNRFIREFGSRMVHVHAKDLAIDRDGLYERGILSAGIGWQVPRMPGLGDVDWPGFFSNLYGIGYDGPVIIEHEDRNFEGSIENIHRGFYLARDVLSPFIK